MFEVAATRDLNISNAVLCKKGKDVQFHISPRVVVLVTGLRGDKDEFFESTWTYRGILDPSHQNGGRLHAHPIGQSAIALANEP